MKQKLLKTMLLLSALVVGLGNAWADTSTLTFTAACGGTGTALVDDDDDKSGTVTWSVTSDASESTYDGTKGVHYGTSKVAVSYLYLTTSDISGTITQIKVNASGASSTSAKLNVSVGGSSFGEEKSLTSSAATYTLTGSASGTIVVAITQSSETKALYCKSVAVTYSTVSGETTTVTIDYSSINNNLFGSNTDGGSLSATVLDNSSKAIDAATVTWSGDNDYVATINAITGAVTLVGVGSVNLKATYAGVVDTYKSSNATYTLTVINENPSLVEIWSEDFSSYSADDVPEGGTYGYECANGGGTTKIYADASAGGTSPELLVAKSSGSFSATIPLITSTYGYSGDLTLKFKSNANGINVKSGTSGITVDGEENVGDGVTFSTKDTHTVTFKGTTTDNEDITIVFTTTTGSNVRIDDIILKGVQEEFTKVATPAISPASGAIASGTRVVITCPTEGATIYYTTDGSTPSSGSTAYNPSNEPTITSDTTIKAIAIKAGLTNSDVATASYTIAPPCETPTFSVSEGVVDKGTSVSLSCATYDATIYYTTNGTNPTTSSSVYSSSLTINANQTIKAFAVKDGMANSEIASATYTIRDFANLPFSWNDGKGSLATGMTQSGLGTDYSSSPKLKFDDTDDELILKINEVPGELTFDIKGNSMGGSYKFSVLESADGTYYSTLKNYTAVKSSTESKSLIPASTTRYIKWIYTTKSSGNVAIGNIQLKGCKSITVGSAGFTTYTTADKVSFPSGVKGYIVTATSANSVTLTEVSKVPADEPIVVEAATGTYYLPVITSSTDDVSSNKLASSDGTVEGNGSTIYALGKKSDVVGFYLVGDGVKVPAGKAYLTVSAGVKEFLTFDFSDNADGIQTLSDSPLKGENIYNLAGQRLQKMQKGINIVNGKKVLK